VKVFEHPLAPPPKPDDLKIRFLDKHLVVVEKPSGMTTLRHNEEQTWPKKRKDIAPTLDEALPRVIARLEKGDAAPAKTKRFPHGQRPSLPQVRAVHRLDRDTSGLMVFARSVQAERHLVDQFRKHTVLRSYVAVVHGHPEAQTITSHLIRDRGDGRRGSNKDGKEGQRAVTHIKPLEQIGPYSMIECRLETGRTHQIRIHLSELGHFLCGDKVYSQPLFQNTLLDASGAPRLALHARELGLVHPITGQQLHFTMPLPKDLEEWVGKLRKAK
jgi:23S rRNA pseudouridine1911/1915/1917 synthase